MSLVFVILFKIKSVSLIAVETIRLNILFKCLNHEISENMEECAPGATLKIGYFALFKLREILNSGRNSFVNKPLLKGTLPIVTNSHFYGSKLLVLLF